MIICSCSYRSLERWKEIVLLPGKKVAMISMRRLCLCDYQYLFLKPTIKAAERPSIKRAVATESRKTRVACAGGMEEEVPLRCQKGGDCGDSISGREECTKCSQKPKSMGRSEGCWRGSPRFPQTVSCELLWSSTINIAIPASFPMLPSVVRTLNLHWSRFHSPVVRFC